MKTLITRVATTWSFRRQIILVFVAGFFFLMAAYVAYAVKTEQANQYRHSRETAIGLTQALVVSALPWLLANDFAGLQDAVHIFVKYPDLRYAMIISPNGRVLAHSDAAKVGQFVADEPSLALIKAPPGQRIIADNESLVDIAIPVELDRRHVGWARIGVERARLADDLRQMEWTGALYVSLATSLSWLAAMLIANRLGYRIGILMRTAAEVQAGNSATRANVAGNDEIAKLADSMNLMLDALHQNEGRYRVLVQSSLDGFMCLDFSGQILETNVAASQMLGYSQEELLHMRIQDIEANETPEEVTAHIMKTARNSGDRFRTRHRRKDGAVIDVEISAQYVAELGERFYVYSRDITELKRAEAKLEEQINELRIWQEITMGREMRVLELKHEVNELLSQAGQPVRYLSAESM